jgi:hypothetical protein
MQPYPTQWTHHHTHRLFHISLALCFGFIVLTILAGLLAVWWGARAATDPVSENVNITAIVGGVNPGPITPSPSSGSVPQHPVTHPTITIVAEPQGQIPQQPLPVGQQVFPAYVFMVTNPAFSGQTSVPNSLVFLHIQGPQTFNSTAVADSAGNWLWQSSTPLPPGTYLITATVYDSQDLSKYGTASTYFIVKPAPAGEPATPGGPKIPPINAGSGGSGIAGDQLFGIFLEILKDYKQVIVGNNIVASITLVNKFSNKEIPDQVIEYEVKDWTGSVIMESSDTVSFSKISRFLKTILTAPATKPGVYRLIVTSTFQGVTSTASDTFVLQPSLPAIPAGASGPTILWSALFGLLLLFLLLVAIAYYQVRVVSRHIKEHNERYHNEKTQ